MSKIAGILISITILALMGCGLSDTSTPEPTRVSLPAVQLPDKPIGLAQVKAEFGQPLSSGISLPDMVENALRSVVEIRTTLSGGTGFIVNSEGLVVTNKHVVQGADRANLRLVSGNFYTANVVGEHDTLDLAYLLVESDDEFTPIAVGDSDKVRVGESVIVIGFPIADELGSEPTVSQGIVSALRSGLIQTDAPVNPGNSGGPMLDQFGNVVGVIVSRVDESGGQDIAGIGFAIPINEVTTDLGGQVAPGDVLPTPTLFPTIGPPPDIEATKAAIEAIDAQRRLEEQATRTAIEAQEEAERLAASLEATRIANRPTPTATPLPTPTSLPTATPTPTPTPEPTPSPTPPTPTPMPHPRTFCVEWEGMVLEWIKQGNSYTLSKQHHVFEDYVKPEDVPDHPRLSAKLAHRLCITRFPTGVFGGNSFSTVGDGYNRVLPGTYEYRRAGDNRVGHSCKLVLNRGSDSPELIQVPVGEPFTFQFFTYHGSVNHNCGRLYRIGD